MNDHDFRRGIALINSGEFYEAHEVLEDAWRESAGPVKLFRQALVQVAVAMHHHSTENLGGARSVLARAMRNLEIFEQGFEGLDVDDLRKQLSAWSAALASKTGDPRPLHVRWLSPTSAPEH